jgi:flagellar biosynthesis/type III secretory pathway protein FliH
MGRLSKSFGRVVPAELLDARREAARIRAEAGREADDIRAEARRAAEALRASAEREGAAAGAETARAEFRRLLSSALRESERVHRAAVPSARRLAVRMAEKIIGHAVSLEPALLDAMVERALAAAAPRSGNVVVRLHPDDYARLVAEAPERVAAGGPSVASFAQRAREAGAAVELWMVADASVDRFGCIVDTASGRLDARVETQLAVLEQAAFPTPAGTSTPSPSPSPGQPTDQMTTIPRSR